MSDLAAHLKGRRFGVALSSAYLGFFAHAGFVRSLLGRGLRPAAWGGTSAGAMVAAMAAAGLAPEAIADRLLAIRRADYLDPRPRLSPLPSILGGRRFARLLERALPVQSFEACPTPLVTVSTNLSRGARHVDRSGPLVPAVHASCALPLLLRPVLRDGDLHLDGGLIDKVPVLAMIDALPIDTLLVHYIPSRRLRQGARLPRTPVAFLDHVLDICRADSWALQQRAARARGVEVLTIETRAPRLNVLSLRQGPAALAAGARSAAEALARPYWGSSHVAS